MEREKTFFDLAEGDPLEIRVYGSVRTLTEKGLVLPAPSGAGEAI